jgi:hypothetical protein
MLPSGATRPQACEGLTLRAAGNTLDYRNVHSLSIAIVENRRRD